MSSPGAHVLPWDQPLLPQAVRWLAREWRADGPLDLSDQLIIVPTRQSGRRLREALAAHAAHAGQAVFSPRVWLPDMLVTESIRARSRGGPTPASRADVLLAWIEVFRTIDPGVFSEVFPVAPPERTFVWARRLAHAFVHLQRELGENGLRFADVLEGAGVFPEVSRWRQLVRLEGLFDAALLRRGLVDPRAARLASVGDAAPPEGVTRVVVLGVPDPLPLACRVLEQFATRVAIALVLYGPRDASPEAHFEKWGQPRSDVWVQRDPGLHDFARHVHLCPDPSTQADRIVAAVRAYAELDGAVAVGIADAEIVAPLHHGLQRAGVAAFDPEARSRRDDALHQLLTCLLEFARSADFGALAALVRCPDVLTWLAAAGGASFSPARFLAALDELHSRNLPPTLDAAREHAPALALITRRTWPELAPALAQLAALHTRMTQEAFPNNVHAALGLIFQGRELSFAHEDEAQAIAAAGAWLDTVEETAAAAARFRDVTWSDAWELALDAFGDSTRYDDKPPHAVELQGWLELLWEDAPHLLIAGLNDGRVPAAIVGDPFLPESLREILGLTTNQRRLARDAYLLEAMVASRAPHGRLDLFFGKTNAAGDPLRPSRLLLRCADEALPARVRFLFRDAASTHAGEPWRRAWLLAHPSTPRVERIRVTGFRAYLECPFRYQLQHVLGMEAVDPFKAELDARDFGTLCHAAVEAMGHNAALRTCTDAAVLREFLLAELERAARIRYGTTLSLPLRIQLDSARQRLARFAEVQAIETAAGWQITHVERDFAFDLGGLKVTGKIDRIDHHAATGAWRVLDYKTTDAPKAPRDVHVRRRKRNEPDSAIASYARFNRGNEELVWTDLQLPLYLRALRAELGANLICGYVLLPKATTETTIAVWTDYDSAWQEAAEYCATAIATAVAAGTFWPPAELDPERDPLASLFHHGTAASVAGNASPP